MMENTVDLNEDVLCLLCVGIASLGKPLAAVGRRTSGREMVEYCFDVQIDDETVANAIVCTKCCAKLTAFYKFKLRAKRCLEPLCHAAAQFKPDEADEDVKADLLQIKEEVKSEFDDIRIEDEQLMGRVKEEVVFDEIVFGNDSEEDLLSVLKINDINDECEEKVAVAKVKKKRGRPKLDCVKTNKLSGGMCDHCGKNVSCLATHLKLHQPDGSRRRIPCKLCDKTFSSYSSKYKHNKIKHLGIKQFCEKCQKSVCSLRQHERLVHSPEKLPVLCVVCGRRFQNQSSLDQHTTVHTKVKPFECPDCGEQFRLHGTMINHKKSIHDGEKTHLCQYCSKGFFKKYHLILHLRSHTNERPVECAECGKRFRTTSCLRMHLKRHSGLRDHVCSVCDMTFFNNGALKVHMVSHTKEKRYSCAYCDIKFGRSDHRNRHQRTAHQNTQPTAAQPVITQPTAALTVHTQLTAAQPVHTQPTAAQLVQTQPTASPF